MLKIPLQTGPINGGRSLQEHKPKITCEDIISKIEELQNSNDINIQQRYHRFFYREKVSYSMADPRLLKNRIALALSIFTPSHPELEGYTFPDIGDTNE